MFKKKQREIQSFTCMIRSAIDGQSVKTALGSPFAGIAMTHPVEISEVRCRRQENKASSG